MLGYYTVRTPQVMPPKRKDTAPAIPEGMTPLEAMAADAAAIRRRNAHFRYKENGHENQDDTVQARRDSIMAYLAEAGPVSIRAISDAMKIDDVTVRNDISRMVTYGEVRRIGTGRSKVYEVEV